MTKTGPQLQNIPAELKTPPHCVVWKLEPGKDGKPTKVPYQPANPQFKASTNNSKTWGTFEQAIATANTDGFSGIGRVLTKDDRLGCVDLDHCRNAVTGEIEAWAWEIILKLNSYTEISPSGGGVHIWVKVKSKTDVKKRKSGNIEIFSWGLYLTMTGNRLENTPTIIEDRQAELDALHAEIFGKTSREEPKQESGQAAKSLQDDKGKLSDEELMEKICSSKIGNKFRDLYSLGIEWLDYLKQKYGYPSQSEADLALCSFFAFWTGKDAAWMDRLFRRSKLMREKWDERRGDRSYGEMTIAQAIANTHEVWKGSQVKRKKKRTPTQNDTGRNAQTIGRGLRLTDWGAAERLVVRHGQNLRYCYPWGKWLVWDGRRWAIDQTGQVRLWGKDVPGAYLAEAAAAHDADQRKALAQFAIKCESTDRQKALLTSAQSEKGIPILPEHLDQDPWLFNVLNGTVDLRTGQLQPHRRENQISKLSPIEYDPQATCPTWQKFLSQIFAGNNELITFIQKAIGYALTGDIREQCLFFLYGTGSNGKSTLLITLHNLFGDYAKRTSTETFLAKKGGQIPNDIAALRGARFVGAVEVEEGRRLAEVSVKEMTGGDPITARFLHAEFFEYMPEFKIFLAVNHRPVIKGTDHAIWRRIRLIPFTVKIHEKEQDRTLPDKLKAELPGIFNWALAGCLQWRYGGLAAPQAVVDATEDYRCEMDTLGGFLQDHCILAPGAEVMSAEIFKK